MMDKMKLKMELLEKLIEEMGDAEVSKFKKEDEPEVLVKEVKADVMPVDEAKEMIKEKMMGSKDSDESCEMEEEEEEEDTYGMSPFMEKLMKKKKMLG